MVDIRPKNAKSLIGILGDRGGFEQTGGIQTLLRLLCRRLEINGLGHRIVTAERGITEYLTHLFVLGCSSPWAYAKVVQLRLLQPSLAVHWIPCFHPPHSVSHQGKSRIACLALRSLQLIGVNVYALTGAEWQTLNRKRCKVISLPFDCEEDFLTRAQFSPTSSSSHLERPNALLFLGRPVAQKGWLQFLSIVSQIELPCVALVPFHPAGDFPSNLKVVINADDFQIAAELRRARILILPSDYESFGFAQAEAMLSGCVVPVLGEWPLWLDVNELDWRSLNHAEWLQRIKAILDDPHQWTEIQRKQMNAWLARPERQEPALPDLYV